jgi:hypothetical protein
MSSAPAPAPQPAAAVPVAPVPPAPSAPTPPGVPAKKKTSPVVWVLAGCGGLILIVGIIAVVMTLFVAHKVKQAGFDPALWERNPGLAATKMIAALNPDVEVLKVDEGRGVITLRDKKSGKTVTMNFEDIKRGRIVFEGDKGEKVEIQGEGEGGTGSVRVKTPEGAMQIGAAAKLPNWVPVYPGMQAQGGFSAQKEGETSGAASFKTNDPVDKVTRFYTDELNKAGFKITTQTTGSNLSILTATDDSTQRQITLTITSADGATSIGLLYGTKK